MANKSRGMWYVSFELPQGGDGTHERGAKKFARAKLAEARNASAGTLNPHLPKRTIASAHILEWLKEPDEADLA